MQPIGPRNCHLRFYIAALSLAIIVFSLSSSVAISRWPSINYWCEHPTSAVLEHLESGQGPGLAQICRSGPWALMIAITLLPELSKLLKTRGPRKRSFLCSSPILRRVKPTLKQPSEMAWRRQRTNGRPLFFNKIKKHLFNSCERFITKKRGTSRALRISQMRRNREAVIAHGNGRSKIDDILIYWALNLLF